MGIFKNLLELLRSFFSAKKSEPVEPEVEQPAPVILVVPPISDPVPVVVEPEEYPIPAPPVPTKNFRKWRLTYYYVAEQRMYSGAKVVPVYDKNGKELCRVEAGFFGQMSLQGTGQLRDGRLLNVAGANVNVKHEDYFLVWERHKKLLSKRPPGYSGLVVRDERVVQASAYRWVPADQVGVGFGSLRGRNLVPYRSLAADIGALRRHEPRWKGKGGVCPLFTKVFIKQFVGLQCPNVDGSMFIHDGWFEVVDTGGGIFGKHFDLFTGSPSLAKLVRIPGVIDVWYDKIDERVPPDDQYDYGLYDR